VCYADMNSKFHVTFQWETFFFPATENVFALILIAFISLALFTTNFFGAVAQTALFLIAVQN
jgi:hypothetical protein